MIILLFVFAELELEQDDDVGDEDPGDGEAAGVAQLEGRHRRNGAVLQNLSSQHFDLKKDVSRYLNTMFHHTQVFKKLHIQTYYVKKSQIKILQNYTSSCRCSFRKDFVRTLQRSMEVCPGS